MTGSNNSPLPSRLRPSLAGTQSSQQLHTISCRRRLHPVNDGGGALRILPAQQQTQFLKRTIVVLRFDPTRYFPSAGAVCADNT